jgi:hypothetical protein
MTHGSRWLVLAALLAAASPVTAQQFNPPQPPSPPLPPGGTSNFEPPSPPLPPGGDANTPAPVPPSGENAAPTVAPTVAPTAAPSGVPTVAPGGAPTAAPSGAPTQAPATSAPPTPGPTSGNFNPADATALLAQKDAISNADSINELDSWTQGGNPCSDWSGVSCDQNGAVISLDLTNLGLQGSLATELSQLSNLGSLKLGQNQLAGSLPGGWASNSAFQSLTELDVSSNRLEGDLPDAYGAAGSFSGLQLLRLGTNAFTGSLPSGWGEGGGFGALQNLLLEDNMLEGELPAEWGGSGRFGSLARLDVSGNDVQGSIPQSWGADGNLPSLTGLVLKPGNERLCGAIPGSLPVLPANAISNGELVCGNTPPAPEPEASAPSPATAPGASPPSGSGSAAGTDTVGVAFALTGTNLVPWTESANQTFASALKAAIGSEFNSTVIRYVGNVPTNSSASSARKLLQSQGITVYYNLEQVSDSAGLQAQLRDQNTLSTLQNALNQNGVNVNGVTPDTIQDGSITIPGQSTGGGGGGGLSTGAIVGIVVGAVVGLGLILLLLCCCCLRRRKRKRGAYDRDPEIVKAGTPIVRPQPTFRSNDMDGGSAGLSYYRRQGSPTASPQHSGLLASPQHSGVLQQPVAPPVILNADNIAYQGQRMTGPSPRSTSPASSPMYPTVKPTDDPQMEPASKASKFSSWWTGRSADGTEEPVAQGPVTSPYAPQITPDNDVELDMPGGPAGPSYAAGGRGDASGSGSRVAEWLRPASNTPSPQGAERAPNQKKKLSSVVSDIDAI